MNQNLQFKRQEHWGHLALQVALLTEQEVTKSMQMLHLICQRLGLENPAADEESKDLAQPLQCQPMEFHHGTRIAVRNV